MKNLLLIQSSLNGEQGNSYQLAYDMVTSIEKQQQVSVSVRDLAKDPLPHLSQEEMSAWMTDAQDRTGAQVALASMSDSLIEEIQQADILVIGMPMYNFGVPSNFKAWIDRIARAGITFRYTENGPQGLLKGKKAIVVAARGGLYAGTPKDSQTTYLKDVLSFVGIDDVEFVYAEGLATQAKEKGLASAHESMKHIALTV